MYKKRREEESEHLKEGKEDSKKDQLEERKGKGEASDGERSS